MELELQGSLRDIRVEKLRYLQEQGRNPFEQETFEITSSSKKIHESFDELEGTEVSIAGRIMQKRMMGKAGFIDIQDSSGTIQIYVRKNLIGDESFADFELYDLGDIIGLEGEVFKTKKEEISVKAKRIVLLTKALEQLPDKFHGLKDTDTRYRKRYIDLIVNPEVKEMFLKRNVIVRAIREYLDGLGYLEVETPILTTVAGGAAARPFLTHHNTLDLDMQMRIANELYLKRLIVGGFDKVYEMGKMFRNEGISIKHNPEFTNIEMYAAYQDYEDMMDLTEGTVEFAVKKLYGTTVVEYDGKTLDFTRPWKRIVMHEAVKEKTGVDFYAIDDVKEAQKVAKGLGIVVEDYWTQGHLVSEAFEMFCEDDLVQPTFVMGHPVEISPLAKRNPEDPRITQRFEAFANTWEIANGFSELNDPIDQRQRFEDQVKQGESGDEESHPMDEDFIEALEVGLPPTGGLGIGVDRLIMLLTGAMSIRDIIFFPTMKPIVQESREE